MAQRTVDRAVMRMRAMGLIESRSTFLDDGSQRANSYVVRPDVVRSLGIDCRLSAGMAKAGEKNPGRGSDPA